MGFRKTDHCLIMTTSTTLEPTTTNEGFPERFIQVCPSDNFTLFLQASGDAWSCGENSRGQLGNQSNESSSTPLIFARGFIKLDVGQFHAGGLDVNKRLFLWGDGWHGEQAIDPNLISENVDERFISLPTQRASAVHDFALGNARTFLINSGGLILACGENTNGVLGTASTENHVRDFELVVTPEGLKFEKIDAGMNHFGAIDENGALWMWGSNEFNKLSLPGETLKVATKVIDANVRSVSCGEDFTLVTLTNGRVLAVGKGGWGQTSSWFDVVGQPSRDYALIEVWGSSDPDFIRGMKIIYADFSEIMLFLDDFFAFKFVPDITSGFKTTKLGTIYSRYTAPFIENADGSKTYDRSNYLFIDVTFQETGFELFEPQDFSLDGWGSSNGDSIVLSYTIDQLTTSTSTSSTTEEPTTSTSSTTEEPTTSTSSTTEEPTTSTSSTTEEPTTSTSSTTEEPTTSTSTSTEEPTTSTSTSTTSTSTTEEPTTSSTTEEPGDPIISSPSGVELYVGAKFLDDGNVPWIVTSKTDADNYE
ncbi:MAG: RCC1 domain-containing protein, partial [Candidatus Poseidoniaceae archaeon]